MNRSLIPFDFEKMIEQKLEQLKRQAQEQWRRNWPKMAALGVVAFLISKRDLSIQVNLQNGFVQAIEESAPVAQSTSYKSKNNDDMPAARAMNTSLLSVEPAKSKPVVEKRREKADEGNLANTFSNMTFKGDDPDLAAKREKQVAYVKRFYKVAQTEMDKYGIPASITLAQGLLESNVGESQLARKNNNHFGIKCFSRSCPKGHCSNYTDDSHKDFFRKYDNAWESFRAHSHLLQKDRYKPLYRLGTKDFKSWAYGLKRAGYATDSGYAEKLIRTIKDLKLYQFDQ